MSHIFQINISDGGVPKQPVHSAKITEMGIVGDKHNDQKHHGGPERALCIFSLEKILDLQKEGHPIFAGSTGENITISGIEWDELLPGVRLRLGTEVEIEITKATHPCKTIRESFSDKNSSRINEKIHPGWSRLYAKVLKTGKISTGDEVKILS